MLILPFVIENFKAYNLQGIKGTRQDYLQERLLVEEASRRHMSRMQPPKKRRRTDVPAHPVNGHASDHTVGRKHPRKKAGNWNNEQDYEIRPRLLGPENADSSRLPIKTQDGWVKQTETLDSSEGSEEISQNSSDSEDELGANTSPPNGTPAAYIPQRQQIINAQEQLARLAGFISENPEEHIGSLKSLADIGSSNNSVIKKYALLTQLAVYRDVIPGYRIRQTSEGDGTTKLSKEVLRLRSFEHNLMGSYQLYVRQIAGLASGAREKESGDMPSLASVAISCACGLLASVPHFNLRSEILKILVTRLGSKTVDDDFLMCRNSLETLFRDDEEGHASVEAVGLLTAMIKAKNYNVDESVINTFLHLRLLSEFASKGSNATVEKNDSTLRGKGRKPREMRQFRTKKQRKLMKEQKAVEKEMEEANAVVSHETRDRLQGEMLKLVFATYFRILKARTPKLMGAVLEGLARYAHLINQDFFGDILEALKELVLDAEKQQEVRAEVDVDEKDTAMTTETRNCSRESLLCVTTAFALLQGQDAGKAASGLKLDLSFFVTHLYRSLLPLSMNPDVELSSKSLHLPDPHTAESKLRPQDTSNKVNFETMTVLLLRSLSSVCLPKTALRSVSSVRVAAFAKQLLMASLHLPEKSCLAMMGLLDRVCKVHGRQIGALWFTEERRGDGVFDALRGEIDGSNPFASTAWEGQLLRKHYCPAVCETVKSMEKHITASR